MKFTVVGLGYVGMAMSVLLARKYKVYAFDIDDRKLDKISLGISPFYDEEISSALSSGSLDLHPVKNTDRCFSESDFVIIATPTDYNAAENSFDTKSVESVTEQALQKNPRITVIIKSTIPIGFVEKLRKKIKSDNIYFSPEFLREGSALYDNLNPSRIIIGGETPKAKEFVNALLNCSLHNNCPIIFTGTKEAEAVKLFANTYLAMRVGFFNELDNFCLSNNLESHAIINAVSHDPRIGKGYNNPSFGYGGYCFPKDTKQMLACFEGIPSPIIAAVVQTNEDRKEFLFQEIIRRQVKSIGVYLLSMKAGSDNYRDSAVLGLIDRLVAHGIKVFFFDPNVINNQMGEAFRVNEIETFFDLSEIVIANRIDETLKNCPKPIFSRDVFGTD